MWQRKIRHILLGVGLVLLTSCGVEKQLSIAHPHTVRADKASVTLVDGKKNRSVNCTMQVVYDSVCCISVQPALGIEMFRVEVTPERVLLINKVQKRFAELDMKTLWTLGLNLGYKEVQHLATGDELPVGQTAKDYFYNIMGEDYHLTVNYPSIKENQPINIKAIDLKRYKQVQLKDILPQ